MDALERKQIEQEIRDLVIGLTHYGDHREAEKGVALFHSLVANHAFIDGNKRTAVTALDHFLLANGFVLGVPNVQV